MKLPAAIVGNTGLYYTCYMLSARGWNVMPTARNTRGIDVVCFSADGKTVRTMDETVAIHRFDNRGRYTAGQTSVLVGRGNHTGDARRGAGEEERMPDKLDQQTQETLREIATRCGVVIEVTERGVAPDGADPEWFYRFGPGDRVTEIQDTNAPR